MNRYAVLLAGLLAVVPGLSDTLTLRDGRTVEGNFVSGTTRQIKLETSSGTMTFDIGQVTSIVFASSGQAAVYQPQAYAQPAMPNQPPPVAGMELLSGTALVVRMIDSVDSNVHQRGHMFRASLDEPVYLNGQQLIPRGANVVVRLVDSKESGKLTGRSSLTLNLASVAVNGRMVDVNTQSVSQVSSSRGARTAKTTGGGAALGAVIGGIAGGGKGAAIGAGAGATAGAGVQVLTKGQRVHIPSETRLSFILESNVRI
jgi:hypothetical protein